MVHHPDVLHSGRLGLGDDPPEVLGEVRRTTGPLEARQLQADPHPVGRRRRLGCRRDGRRRRCRVRGRRTFRRPRRHERGGDERDRVGGDDVVPRLARHLGPDVRPPAELVGDDIRHAPRSRARCCGDGTPGAGVSNTTATHGMPAAAARSRQRRRWSASRPSVSMTVVSWRRSRRVTMSSSRAKASVDAARSCSPSPTSARNASLDTICAGSNHCAAHVDLPDATGPTSTTTQGDGNASGSSVGAPVTIGHATRRSGWPGSRCMWSRPGIVGLIRSSRVATRL